MESENLASQSPKYIEAVAMYASGRLDRASKLLELHLLHHPQHYHGRVLRAQVLLLLGRHEEAVGVLLPHNSMVSNKAELDPGLEGADARRILAEALLLSGEFEAAEPVLEQALQRNAEDPRLLLLLARVHRNAGRGEAAATLYQRALIYRGELGVAAAELSQVYAARGLVDGARTWYGVARQLLPETLLRYTSTPGGSSSETWPRIEGEQ